MYVNNDENRQHPTWIHVDTPARTCSGDRHKTRTSYFLPLTRPPPIKEKLVLSDFIEIYDIYIIYHAVISSSFFYQNNMDDVIQSPTVHVYNIIQIELFFGPSQHRQPFSSYIVNHDPMHGISNEEEMITCMIFVVSMEAWHNV